MNFMKFIVESKRIKTFKESAFSLSQFLFGLLQTVLYTTMGFGNLRLLFIVPHTRKCNDKLLGQTTSKLRQKYSKLQGERVRVYLYHTEVEKMARFFAIYCACVKILR